MFGLGYLPCLAANRLSPKVSYTRNCSLVLWCWVLMWIYKIWVLKLIFSSPMECHCMYQLYSRASFMPRSSSLTLCEGFLFLPNFLALSILYFDFLFYWWCYWEIENMQLGGQSVGGNLGGVGRVKIMTRICHMKKFFSKNGLSLRRLLDDKSNCPWEDT